MTTGRIARVIASALLLSSPATVARAVDTITAGAVGSGSTTIWPIYIGNSEWLLRRCRHQGRPGLRPVIDGDRAAGRGRFDQPDGRQRPRRSDPRHRQGRADRDLARRHAGAALCAAGQAGDQEHQGPQGQDHQHRRRQGHHPHLCRTHAGAQRGQIRAMSTTCSPARPRRACRRCSRARSMPRS